MSELKPLKDLENMMTPEGIEKSERLTRYLVHQQLEGINLPEKTLAMFDMFRDREYTAEQQVNFIKKLYGYRD